MIIPSVTTVNNKAQLSKADVEAIANKAMNETIKQNRYASLEASPDIVDFKYKAPSSAKPLLDGPLSKEEIAKRVDEVGKKATNDVVANRYPNLVLNSPSAKEAKGMSKTAKAIMIILGAIAAAIGGFFVYNKAKEANNDDMKEKACVHQG